MKRLWSSSYGSDETHSVRRITLWVEEDSSRRLDAVRSLRECRLHTDSGSVPVLEGLVSADRDPLDDAPLRVVVGHRVVLDSSIVPERDGIPLPAKAALVLGDTSLGVELPQHSATLFFGHPLDGLSKGAIDIDALESSDRVRTDDGVFRVRLGLVEFLDLFLAGPPLHEPSPEVCEIVDSDLSFDDLLRFIVQPLIGGVHIGEERISPCTGDLKRPQDGSKRRFQSPGDIRVPDILRASTLLIVLDDEDFRKAFLLRSKRVDFELTKETSETKVIFGGDVLIPEEDDFPIEKSLLDLLHGRLVLRLAQVDAEDLRTKGGRQGTDFEFRHGSLSIIPCPGMGRERRPRSRGFSVRGIEGRQAECVSKSILPGNSPCLPVLRERRIKMRFRG